MVYDTKHAIAWLKSNASTYKINPEKIVIGGGSAGAHLALLAGYTDENKELTPPDLENSDLTVRGVISSYGQSELSATYYHTCQHLTKHSGLTQAKKESRPGRASGWMWKRMGADFHRLGFDKDVEPGWLCPILGGSPDEIPEAYALFSPISHVHKNCPYTLLIHGEHDILAPLNAIRRLHKSLVNAGVPVILHTVPRTDHAFDLVLPKISPSAHNAIYHVERFLAMMESDDLRETNSRYFKIAYPVLS
jgi:acetyl esterase/lipase